MAFEHQIVPVERYSRVGDHDSLGMEATIGDEDAEVVVAGEVGARAAEHLARRERPALRQRHLGIMLTQRYLGGVHGALELNRATQRDAQRGVGEVVPDSVDEVRGIYVDLNEHVQYVRRHLVDWHQARVPIVYKQLTA